MPTQTQTQQQNLGHRILILDDYQHVALKLADWSPLSHIPITVLNEAIPPQDLVKTLKPFTIIHAMRERTKFTPDLLIQLPNLKFITTTGSLNRGIDLPTAARLSILVSGTYSASSPRSSPGTIEQTFALLLALSRRILPEHQSVVSNSWQTGVATTLYGKTLGLVGVGRLGKEVGTIAKAFGMKVVAWSPNLDKKRAEEAGVEYRDKDDLFKEADFVSVHLVLGESTKGIIGSRELDLLKPTSYIINTSRGPLIDEPSLIRILQDHKLAGAGLDVFDLEPLPKDHPFKKLDNVVLSPHMGYVDDTSYNVWWPQTVENIEAFLKGEPLRLMK